MDKMTASRIKANGKKADLKSQPIAEKQAYLKQFETALKTLDKRKRK